MKFLLVINHSEKVLLTVLVIAKFLVHLGIHNEILSTSE